MCIKEDVTKKKKKKKKKKRHKNWPVFFLLYINDLTHDIKSQDGLFADDTAVYYS